jgi:hypothetical protein
MQIAGHWRVVVPIRGKLTPRVCADVFTSRRHAEEWLCSEDGRLTVDELRARRPQRAGEEGAQASFGAS